MGDNTCGCCATKRRDTLAVVTFVFDQGASAPHAVLVKLCARCRLTHWKPAGRSPLFASYVYERVGHARCPDRQT